MALLSIIATAAHVGLRFRAWGLGFRISELWVATIDGGIMTLYTKTVGIVVVLFMLGCAGFLSSTVCQAYLYYSSFDITAHSGGSRSRIQGGWWAVEVTKIFQKCSFSHTKLLYVRTLRDRDYGVYWVRPLTARVTTKDN